MNLLLFGSVLEFPEDKSEYIPAAIEFFIIIVLCVGLFMFLKKLSNKQLEKTKDLEERILRERQEHTKSNQ